ncbi:hypothetical protein KDA_22820 [Dictyobacter alpinus]|uniref:Peptidase S53 domain-containing protein n=1 Tax=Dictyobacter alpinus TaxID=2014873 RepID=A0A402B624_9CHLR|nr:S53 family peptidase [Dictyobacter alpinus]GCE26798.1 hypothetical protein KDA_22820 [Dictyobacter alpinus]
MILEPKKPSRQSPLPLILLFSLIITISASSGLEVFAHSSSATYYQHKAVPGVLYRSLGQGHPYDLIELCQQKMAPKRCYGVKQMQHAYDIAPLLAHNITGKGRTIVLLDAYQSPHLANDLAAFNKLFDLPTPALTVVSPYGVPDWDSNSKTQQAWSAEITLDVEWAHAIAPDAAITVVEAKSENDEDLVPALQYIVDKDLGDIVSMSFGEGENCPKGNWFSAWHAALVAATKKNMTLIAASGDNGGAQQGCDDKSWQKTVSTPASDTLVTSVGGTILDADVVTGAYRGETVWNEPTTQSASGGGFSTAVSRPPYQLDAVLPDVGRGLPDVAYNSSMNRAVLSVWSDGPAGPHGLYLFGGTSAGAPQWAGIIALACQAANKRIGALNPMLYTIGKKPDWYKIAFHDIVSGNNTLDIGTPGSGIQTFKGYEARPGWDAATGWGSPDVANLIPRLVQLAKAQ